MGQGVIREVEKWGKYFEAFFLYTAFTLSLQNWGENGDFGRKTLHGCVKGVVLVWLTAVLCK